MKVNSAKHPRGVTSKRKHRNTLQLKQTIREFK
jgi:hypothetical protein